MPKSFAELGFEIVQQDAPCPIPGREATTVLFDIDGRRAIWEAGTVWMRPEATLVYASGVQIGPPHDFNIDYDYSATAQTGRGRKLKK